MFVGVVNPARRKSLDRLRQQMGVVGHFDSPRDFRLRLFGRVQHGLFAFDQRPLERLFGAVDVEAFAVLAGRVEQRTIDACRQVRVAELDVVVSTANGELYLGINSSRIVPEPKHETYSASALVSARHGPTQCVA